MSNDSVLDAELSMLVAEILEEIREAAGGAVDDGAAVAGATLLRLNKRFLVTEKGSKSSKV